MTSVRVSGVSKRFGATDALREVDLSVEDGELFFLLGPSGCGKTTLLRVLAGFVQPDAGRVCFGERDVSNVPPHKRNTGMVFQNYALWPHMTVLDNVAYGLKVRSIAGADARKRAGEALAMVRMGGYGARRPNELSGGQQQRVALARALVIAPELILLDEPLSNLDAKLRLEMRAEIRRIHRETGITTVYVTHDQAEALSMAGRIAVMDEGRVVEVGAPRDLYERPARRFTAQFIGETNLIEGAVRYENGQPVAIDTPLGQAPWPAERPAPAAATATCSLRPEAVYVERNGSAAGPQSCRFEGEVTDVTYLGDTIQLRVAVGGLTLSVHELHPRTLKVAAGQRITCRFDPDDLVALES